MPSSLARPLIPTGSSLEVGRPHGPARVGIRELHERWRRQPPRRDKRRQSRRNVWLTLLLFVGVQVGLSANFALYPNQRDPHYRMATQEAGPVQQGQPRVAILGSSRLALGWQPKTLTDAEGVHWLNLSRMGGGTLTMSVYQRRLIEDGHDPDLLILEVNPLFFDRHHWDQEVKANYWPAHRLRPSERTFFQRMTGSARPSLLDDWVLTDLCPLAAFRFDLLALVMPRLIASPQRLNRDLVLGRPADDPRLIEEQREARIDIIRRNLLPVIPNFRVAEEPQRAMSEILASCRRRGQPAVLVMMPEGPTFRSFYPNKYWQEFQHVVKEMATKYHVPLLDCREWMTEDDFEDSHHLTLQGGEHFTRRFWQEHVQPRLASRGLLGSRPDKP